MKLDQTNKEWESLAASDPMWAVLTDPLMKDGRWEAADFFAAGANEVETIWELLNDLNKQPSTGLAVDFGCGVGRLAQALARRFQKVLAVDCSPSMLKKASELDASNGKIEWRLNESENLNSINDGVADFVFSSIVLQHIPVSNAKQFILEFCRILKPGGLLCFQIPTKRVTTFHEQYQKIKHYLFGKLALRTRLRGLKAGRWISLPHKNSSANIIRMHTTKLSDLERTVIEGGCSVITKKFTNHTAANFNGKLTLRDEPFLSDGYVSALFIVEKIPFNVSSE